jgi:penicillin-binding protein 2
MNMRPDRRRVEPKNLYRFASFSLAIVVVVAALSARMFYMQLVQGPQPDQTAVGPATVSQPIQSGRGLIYDASYTALVKNVASWSVSIVPNDLPLSQKASVVDRLANLLNLDPVGILIRIDTATGSLYEPVKVADNIPVDVARVIQENPGALPGVEVQLETNRQYPEGQLFGQLVGYTGRLTADQYAQLKNQGYLERDSIGQAGLEESYEQQLRGQYGESTVTVDGAGRPVPGAVSSNTPEVPGESIQLSIDTHEQQIATQALQFGLTNAHVTKGVLIAENPQNGQILAMVSLPTYDDQVFANGISEADYQKLSTDPNKPLINKAISEQYAPGSTFKLVTGTAGLQSGKITAASTIETRPYVQIGGYRFWDWNRQGFGALTVVQGLADSSDTFFYQLAQMVGLDTLTTWAQHYGFGTPTGIDLPGEAGGIVPTSQWAASTIGRALYPGEVLYAGIGQGFDAVTPLQLLNAYSSLANGGTLYEPHVVSTIRDASGNVVQQIQPKVISKLPASQQTLLTMRLGTRAVVTSRHTQNLVDLPIKVAGKTGTAEFGIANKYGVLPYHEWFVGYTPGDPYSSDFSKTDSQLAVVAFVYGADSAGNVATEIAKYYMMLHYGLKGNPTSPSTPGNINMWAFRTTNNYFAANNN